MTPDNSPKWTDLWREGYLTPALIASFGIWLHAADELLVATVMPHAINDIGGAQFIAWTFALYEIGSIVAGAAAAFLALKYGLRRSMTWSAILYGAGCAASALSPDMSVMLAGRLAQGTGGGALVALSFIAISTLIPARLMARAMGLLSLVWGLSAFTGPLVGGVFAEIGFWRGGFWFFAVQAALLAGLIGLLLRRSASQKPIENPGRIPLLRLAVLSAGVVVIAAAGINVEIIRSGILVFVGLLAVACFLNIDRKADRARLLPRRPFSMGQRTGAGLVMVLCFSFATIPLSVYGPVLMLDLHGASALVAGYVIALSSIGWSVTAVLTAGARERYDARLIFTGASVLVCSIFGLMYAIPSGPIALIAMFACLEGAGFGVAWTFILRRITALAPEDERERMSTALPTTQRFGYAAGAAFTGIVANSAGFSTAMDRLTAEAVGTWVFAAMLPVAAIGLAAAWIFTRQREPGTAVAG